MKVETKFHGTMNMYILQNKKVTPVYDLIEWADWIKTYRCW